MPIRFLPRCAAWLSVALGMTWNAGAQETEDGASALTDLVGISGFVDASYTYTNTDDSNTFGLDQVEIVLERNFGDIGSLRVDVDWTNDGEGGFGVNAEQGYMTLNLGMGRTDGTYPTLTVGKFHAPMGIESGDPPFMYQYSNSLVFLMALPYTISGAMLSMDLGSGIDAAVHLSNGSDQNVDKNMKKMIGGRIGYRHDVYGGIGFAAMRGERPGSPNDLTMYDFDLLITPTPKLLIGGEYNIGKTERRTHHEEDSWNGFQVMAHLTLTDIMGLTGRYDYFAREETGDDHDDHHHGAALNVTQQALTIAPTFALTDGLGFLMELRRDFADEAIFGDSEKSKVNFAFEMTYTF